MIQTCKLDKIIQKYGIIKYDVPLPHSILGHYRYEDGLYIILINDRIVNHERIYRGVLAEEVGHYRTTIGDITPRKHMCYSERIVIDKQEQLALKWAAEFLIPTENLIELLSNSPVVSLEYLSDYYLVTKEFLMTKFKFMSKIKPIWNLDKGRSLCLYNLPSVFIFNESLF